MPALTARHTRPFVVGRAGGRLCGVSSPAPAAADHPQVPAAAAALRAALPLTTARATLREVRAGDAGALHAYRSDPSVTRFLSHPPLDEPGVQDLLRRWGREPGAVSVVAVLADRVVGDVRVRFRPASAMAPATTREVDAALGYAFHPDVHGRGLATECVRAVVAAVVGAAGARRVTARVFAPAAPSSRLLERVGFTRDGVDRAAVLSPDGTQWWDDELWSLLADRGSMS